MTFFSKKKSPINLRTISSVSSFSWNHFIHQKIEKVLSAIGEGNSFRKKRLSPDDCWQMALLSMADCIRISCKRKKRRQIWDIPAADAFGLRIHGDCSSMTNCRYQLFFFLFHSVYFSGRKIHARFAFPSIFHILPAGSIGHGGHRFKSSARADEFPECGYSGRNGQLFLVFSSDFYLA